MNNYLIIYDYGEFFTVDAKDIKECILIFAEYTGTNCDLFMKSLSGCQTIKDYVDMFNHYSNYGINKIHIIKETIYTYGE